MKGTAQNVIATLEHVKSALKVVGDQLAKASVQRTVSVVVLYSLAIAKNANLVRGEDIVITIALVGKTAHNVIS